MGKTIKARKTIWSYGYEGRDNLIIYTDKNNIPLLVITEVKMGGKIATTKTVLIETNTKITPVE